MHSFNQSKVDDKDQHVDVMLITASGRFFATCGKLFRMRRSMSLVGRSPFSLTSTPDSPSVAAALSRKRFRLVSKSFELSNDEAQTAAGVEGDDEEYYSMEDAGMNHLPQEFLSLPASHKVSIANYMQTYVCSYILTYVSLK